MVKHRVFKFKSAKENKLLVWIPTLYNLYVTELRYAKDIPCIIEDETEFQAKKEIKECLYSFSSCTLILTTRCNLSCLYCYEKGNALKHQNMTEKTAFAAINYIIDWATKLNKIASISFFGGEPTLNWIILKKATDYFKRKALENNCRGLTRITTNGCMTINKAKWLANNIDNITVSMDGYKEIHDWQRDNSFNLSFRTAKVIYDIMPPKISFRVTVTEKNVQSLPMITLFLAKEFPNCIINFEPVESSIRNDCLDLAVDYSLFFNRFLESVPVAASLGAKIRTSVSMIGSAKNRFCGIGDSNFMILPDGRILACNRMIGEDSISDIFCYGYFKEEEEEFVFDDKKYNFLQELTVDNIQACKDCVARFSCRGDCPATKAVVYKNGFEQKTSPYCKEIQEFTKNLLEYIAQNGTDGLAIK